MTESSAIRILVMGQAGARSAGLHDIHDRGRIIKQLSMQHDLFVAMALTACSEIAASSALLGRALASLTPPSMRIWPPATGTWPGGVPDAIPHVGRMDYNSFWLLQRTCSILTT